MIIRFIGPLLSGGLLMLAALMPATAATTGGPCSPSTGRYLTSDVGSSTKSITFQNIPEAAVSFTQGGATASCVIVRFSAVTAAAANDAVLVQASVDNTATFNAMYSSNDGALSAAHSFEFVFAKVAPGPHVVRLRFSSNGGGTASVYNHTTIVQFAP